jgi:hypothetical protein
MRYSFLHYGVSALFAMTVISCGSAQAQMGETLLNYKDPSQRTSRRAEREAASKKTPAPGAAVPGKPVQAAAPGAKPGMTRTTGKTGGTTGTANRSANKGAGKPTQGGGGLAVGKQAEFTKEMAESLRARRVDFDPQEMADKPGVILLNPRKLQ